MDIKKFAREVAKQAALNTYRQILKMGQTSAALEQVKRSVGKNGQVAVVPANPMFPLDSDYISITCNSDQAFKNVCSMAGTFQRIGKQYNVTIRGIFGDTHKELSSETPIYQPTMPRKRN